MPSKKTMLQSEKEMPPGTGDTAKETVGGILRKAREDQGLDYTKLSEMTRLRPFILESLENEEWNTFSASVFIKGFLRSYAKALELDVEKVLRLYEEKNPSSDSVPKPLPTLTPIRKRTPVLFIILILLAGFAFFALHYYTSQRKAKQQLDVTAPPKRSVEPSPKRIERHEESPAIGSENGKKIKVNTDTVQEKPEWKPQTPPEITVEPSEMKAPPGPAPKPMTLKADVKERTWVKIITDQEEPREYVFRPGSHPEWKAKEGFEVFI